MILQQPNNVENAYRVANLDSTRVNCGRIYPGFNHTRGDLMKILSILGVILLVASVCSAATLRVPSQFEYIQQAIVEADLGDTILVGAGSHYPEPHDGTRYNINYWL